VEVQKDANEDEDEMSFMTLFHDGGSPLVSFCRLRIFHHLSPSLSHFSSFPHSRVVGLAFSSFS